MFFKDFRTFETEVAGRKLVIETGKMAQLANGSCIVRYGETEVLCTATMAPKPREGVDFFPLSVDFEEKLYSVGRIPGSFMRREGRPTEKAILTSEIGINPQNDGKVIRLNFPPLTEERRKDIVKDVRKTAEDSKVSLRNHRRDALDKLKALKKNGEITEDDESNGEKKIQNLTDKYCKEIDELVSFTYGRKQREE